MQSRAGAEQSRSRAECRAEQSREQRNTVIEMIKALGMSILMVMG